jgi:hypothetical protein
MVAGARQLTRPTWTEPVNRALEVFASASLERLDAIGQTLGENLGVFLQPLAGCGAAGLVPRRM